LSEHDGSLREERRDPVAGSSGHDAGELGERAAAVAFGRDRTVRVGFVRLAALAHGSLLRWFAEAMSTRTSRFVMAL
jgi:hypothetical protein